MYKATHAEVFFNLRMKFLTLARLRDGLRVVQDLYESEMKTVRKPGKRHAIHETVRPSIVLNHCMLPERVFY